MVQEKQLLATEQRIDRRVKAETAGTYMSWDWSNDGGYFEPKEEQADKSARGYAIRAIKREIIYCGYEIHLMKDTGFYGTEAVACIKALQKDAGLEPDGVVGVRTMKALCQRRVQAFEAGNSSRIEIINNLLGKTLLLESALYPACRNTYSFPESGQNDLDPNGDHGISQINRPLSAHFSDGSLVCPGGDWQYAYRIGLNIKLLAEHMRYYYHWLKGFNPTGAEGSLWMATVMAHNAPYWAKEWMLAGFPKTGGGTVTVGNWVGDKYEWCYLYTHAVYGQTW